MDKKKDNLVYKSNSIIEASYTLSVAEQRLLLACISMLNSDNELDVTKGYTLTVDQAQDIFYTDKDRKNAYRDLKSATESLYDARIKLQSDDGRYEMLTRWVSTVKFDNEEMTATLYFHNEIKPYISQLTNKFTKYRLQWIAELKSKYSIRIYELIVSWYCQNQSYKEMEIAEFRELLDMGGKYERHNDFLRYVVNPSLAEINEYTDFELEIGFKKRGRAYRWIQLRYNQKEAVKKAEERRKLKREQREQGEARDDRTVDMFTQLSDKQIKFIARNHVFQEHLGSLGKLQAGEKYGSEKTIELAVSFLKTGEFSEMTKYLIKGTLEKVKQ